jgi:citrate synthase
MTTRDMTGWQTAICKVESGGGHEEIIVRGHRLGELIGRISFAEVMFLMLQGRLPEPPQARVLDALLVASIEHGIAPPSMISRCFASYGADLQVAVGTAALAFGDRMGGLGEQMAKMMVERLARLGPDASAITDSQLAAEARAVVAEARAAGTRVPGYGIPLHTTDPRAPKLLEIARAEGVFGPYCRFAVALETALAESRGRRAVPMNLDGASACLALDLGFDWRTVRLFLITPRTVSAAAHYLEEQAQDTTWRHLRADQIDYVGNLPPKES